MMTVLRVTPVAMLPLTTRIMATAVVAVVVAVLHALIAKLIKTVADAP